MIETIAVSLIFEAQRLKKNHESLKILQKCYFLVRLDRYLLKKFSLNMNNFFA